MKRKPSSPNHIQTVSKEPVSGIQMARVADEKARVKLRGSAATAGCPGWAPASPPADSTRARPGSPTRSPASRPQHDQSENIKIVTI